MTKLGLHRLKSASTPDGRRLSQNERANSMASGTPNSNVSQEYKAALRTSSYEEMFSKVQIQLKRTRSDLLSSASSRNICVVHLSETLLEPGKETLADMIKTLNLHRLIVDYFEASSEACNVCELLLRGIRRTRMNYCWIKRAVNLSRFSCENNSDNYIDSSVSFRMDDLSAHKITQSCEMIRRELAMFASLRNPLSIISSGEFHNIHDDHVSLLRRITKKRKKIAMRVRIARFCKRIGSCCMVASCTTLGAASLVLAIHSVVGILLVPGLMSSCLGLSCFTASNKDSPPPRHNRSSGERLRMQLDSAARWLFILIHDMDTVRSLVGKLWYELERIRAQADIGTKNETMLKEVVRELDSNSIFFMEQLDELEEHIYLCLLTINRSRRSLLHEILMFTRQGGDDEN